MPGLVLFVVTLIGAGYLLRRSGRVRAETARDLNEIVFMVTLPPLVFRAVHGAGMSWSMLVLPGLAWGATLLGVALGWLVARAMRLDRASAGAVVLATAFGNTTFFGYPVVLAFYGPDHLAPAVLYDLLGASIAANSIGVLVASLCGQSEAGSGIGVGATLRRLARLPPLWALGLGLALRGVPLPTAVDDVLRHMGVATVPIIMLSIGMSLEVRHGPRAWGVAALVAAGRLLVVPGAVFAVTGTLDLPPEWRRAAVIQAGMPSMFFALTLSLLFRLRVELALDAIVATLVAGVATLPFWHWLLG